MPSVQSSSASAGSPGADGVLIVGGGQAAMHLASSLRELGWQAAVTIVGEEPRAPYQRPPLSKAFLSGNADPTTLEFRSAEQYERDRITVLTGQRVTDVRAAAPGRPGVAVTEGGDRLEFGRLALATGAPAAAAGGARGRPGRGLLPARRRARARAARNGWRRRSGCSSSAAASSGWRRPPPPPPGQGGDGGGGRGPAHRAGGRAGRLRLLRRGAPAPRRARPARHGRVAVRRATGPASTGRPHGVRSPGRTWRTAASSRPTWWSSASAPSPAPSSPSSSGWPARAASWSTPARGPATRDRRGGRLRGHPASRGRRRLAWSASSPTGTRSTTPRSPRPPWPGCRPATTRCRGSGPTRASSSCRSPGCRAGSTRRCCAATPAGAVLGALLPRRPAAGGARGQLPARLPGGPPRARGRAGDTGRRSPPTPAAAAPAGAGV